MSPMTPESPPRSPAATAATPGSPRRLPGMIVVGLGTAVAMWFLGYLGRLPVLDLPAPALLTGLVGVQLLGAAVAGRLAAGGAAARCGAGAGLVTALVNLLVLGSVLTRASDPAAADAATVPTSPLPSAPLWVAGFLGVGAVLGALGGRLGGRRQPTRPVSSWCGALACVAAGATFLLLVIGGVVTSYGAGLAVPDWPTSFGAHMFLLPLAKMTGGIYYEHTHRLFASLVGFVTVALFLFVVATDRRRWLWGVAALALLLVIGQGVMGGLRVTLSRDAEPVADGGLDAGRGTQAETPRPVASGELNDPARETVASRVLKVAHGVTAQLFFGLLVALAAFTSRAWRLEPRRPPAELEERGAARWLLGLMVVQLVLGAMTRHIGQSPWIILHLGVALAVLLVAVFAAALACKAAVDAPILRALGSALLVLVLVQFVLGTVAFGVTHVGGTGARVIVTTTHQCVGALLLADVVLLVAWSHRLRERSGRPQAVPAPAP